MVKNVGTLTSWLKVEVACNKATYQAGTISEDEREDQYILAIDIARPYYQAEYVKFNQDG